VEYLLDALAALGWSGTVITAERGGGEVPDREAFPVRYLEGVTDFDGPLWWGASRRAFLAQHEARPFDLIISLGYAAWSLLRLPAGRRVPIVYWGEGFEPEHFLNRFNDVDGLVSLVKYPLIKVPEVAFFTGVERSFVRRADKVVAAASHIFRHYRRFYGVPAERLMLIHNWIDTDRFSPDPAVRDRVRRELGFEPGQRVLMMASTVSKQKGFHIGIEAAAPCLRGRPELRLLAVGDGPFRPQLERRCRELGIAERVRWTGAADQSKVAGFLKAADIFLAPSLRYEATSYVVLEALANGLAVVGSDRAGVAEAIGEAGLLAPPGDLPSWTRALERLFGDPALVERLKAAARQRAAERFSRRRAQGDIERLLAETL